MEAFIEALMQPGSWNQTQWLAVAIGLFVIIASVYFVIRLYQILRNAGKSTYKPNIGMARLKAQGRHPQQRDERERDDED